MEDCVEYVKNHQVNLPSKDLACLKKMKKKPLQKNIVAVKAKKGNSIVLLERGIYESKVLHMSSSSPVEQVESQNPSLTLTSKKWGRRPTPLITSSLGGWTEILGFPDYTAFRKFTRLARPFGLYFPPSGLRRIILPSSSMIGSRPPRLFTSSSGEQLQRPRG